MIAFEELGAGGLAAASEASEAYEYCSAHY
jgi:hypothetical protein